MSLPKKKEFGDRLKILNINKIYEDFRIESEFYFSIKEKGFKDDFFIKNKKLFLFNMIYYPHLHKIYNNQ